MVRLQRPKYAYFAGRVRPYEDAVFHISSEAVLRGLNVFEGIKG
jgi:branched-chain amino acid aminotransferase